MWSEKKKRLKKCRKCVYLFCCQLIVLNILSFDIDSFIVVSNSFFFLVPDSNRMQLQNVACCRWLNDILTYRLVIVQQCFETQVSAQITQNDKHLIYGREWHPHLTKSRRRELEHERNKYALVLKFDTIFISGWVQSMSGVKIENDVKHWNEVVPRHYGRNIWIQAFSVSSTAPANSNE